VRGDRTYDEYLGDRARRRVGTRKWNRRVRRVLGILETVFNYADAVREERPDLLIDAPIGYGLTTGPRGTAADLITWANGTGVPILFLDVVVRPRRTMTLALLKTGLHLEHTEQLVLADIGIPADAFRRAGPRGSPIYRVGTISRAESNVSPASERKRRSNVAKTPLRRFARAKRYASVSCR